MENRCQRSSSIKIMKKFSLIFLSLAIAVTLFSCKSLPTKYESSSTGYATFTVYCDWVGEEFNLDKSGKYKGFPLKQDLYFVGDNSSSFKISPTEKEQTFDVLLDAGKYYLYRIGNFSDFMCRYEFKIEAGKRNYIGDIYINLNYLYMDIFRIYDSYTYIVKDYFDEKVENLPALDDVDGFINSCTPTEKEIHPGLFG